MTAQRNSVKRYQRTLLGVVQHTVCRGPAQVFSDNRQLGGRLFIICIYHFCVLLCILLLFLGDTIANFALALLQILSSVRAIDKLGQLLELQNICRYSGPAPVCEFFWFEVSQIAGTAETQLSISH